MAGDNRPPLDEYARKRTFDKTPEPGPAAPTDASGRTFCVQRHHARRLHYDLRLEMGGVLKSWAVPQGPTLDPAEKRLAVHVEDHPLEYGSFEGNIPKGNYGAGSVMLWDAGTYELLGDKPVEQQMEIGDLKFRLHGSKLVGDFALVRMKGRGKGNEWLLIKKKDQAARPGWDLEAHAVSVATGRTQEEIALNLPAKAAGASTAGLARSVPGAVAAPMLDSVLPMQAFATATPPPGTDWLHEVKWDGVRAICYIDAAGVRLVTRNGNRCEAQYPELSAIRSYVKAETAVLDGEVAVADEHGRPRFQLIQHRIHVTAAHTIANLARTQPAQYFAFDLLYLDGHDLRKTPLAERKHVLQAILVPGPVVRYSEHFEGDPETFLEAAKQNQLEGIVSKRASSMYEPRRSPNWLKTKIVSQQEFVICGFTKGDRGGYFGALVLGLYEGRELVWSGNVGTGFDTRTLESVSALLAPIVNGTLPFRAAPAGIKDITWVRPELVCAVKFANWTDEGRLRAPVFLGLRNDLDPRECVRETTGDAPPQPEAAAFEKRQPLVAPGRTEIFVTVDGKRLKFTNLDKVYFPKDGVVKRDVINYYDAVADLILPYLRNRPLSLKRYPDGIEAEYFFQKDAADSFASWLRTEPILAEHNQAPTNFVVADDRASLLYLANLGCIDQNPWMSSIGSLDNPDFILIDLDPQEGCPFTKIVEAALIVRRKLDLIGLEGYPKTTGGDGMHVYVPVEAVYSYEQTRTFAQILATIVAAERPDLFTTPRPLSRREKGKVYFDYVQNGKGKTIAGPYVLRAYQGAPVATPLAWREVTTKLTPQQFNIRNAVERFARSGDLFQGVLENRQKLEPAMERLEPMVHALRRQG